VLARNHLLAGAGIDDPIATDKYRLLRTRIGQIMSARSWRSIGVTSPGTKAGKSVTAINLAISTAREANFKVLLVDCDIRKPSVKAYMGLESSTGLPDYLEGKAGLDDVIVDIENIPNLSVLPGADAGITGSAPELLKSERMHDLLQALPASERSTVVVVDLPPALIGDDVIAVAENLDCLLVVIDAASTDADDLKHTVELLQGFNVVGTVLNNSDEKPKQHEGYYSAYYTERSGDSASTASPATGVS
jgi:capsular exopolysaccharide synthesis family protein